MIRRVTATRYVTPLREGGSLPAIVEADDDGLYVAKFRGAGHGEKALVAELIAGEIGRALGLLVPEIVLVDFDPRLAAAEPDGEIRDLLGRSGGLNVGLDFLPGALGFDPAAGFRPERQLAADVVWFDAFVTNVDRTPRNPNLLTWHRRMWLIDHGAALYFHHLWSDAEVASRSPFAAVKDHILLPWATELAAAGARLTPHLGAETAVLVLAEIPDDWLDGEPRFATPAEHRAAYARYLSARLEAAPIFLEEAERARGALV